MHSPKQKLGLPLQTCECGVLVLKGSVGMQDRLLHEKQRIANEAVTIATNPIKKDAYQSTPSSKGTIPGDSKHSTDEGLDYVRSVDSHEGSVSSNTDQIPLGVPLPKPPVLPYFSQVNLHDSGSSHFGSTGSHWGNNELTTDDESAGEKSALCESKIYENSVHQKQRQCPPRVVHYNSMNADEMIFLEAACALSQIGGDIGHVSATKFEQLPSFDRNFSMRANPSQQQATEIASGISLSIGTMENHRKMNAASKKRQPLGPPPFRLPKIRKTTLP